MRAIRPTPFTGLFASLVLTAGCAAGSGGQMGTGMAATMGGSEVLVDETLPSVMAYPQANVAAVWKVLPAAFRELGMTAGVLDAGNLVYGNDRVPETTVGGKSTRDLFRCGAGSSLSVGQYRVQFGITAQPRPASAGGTELFVHIEAFGRMVSASRSGTTHCVSEGDIELMLKGQVAIELARIGM